MTIFYYYVLQYVGVAASASVFVLQFISLYLHADSVEEDQKRPLSLTTEGQQQPQESACPLLAPKASGAMVSGRLLNIREVQG